MPIPAQSFVAEQTRGDRKIFDTLDACLFEEVKALHQELIIAVTLLHFVDGVPVDAQFDKLRPKFTALRDTGRAWQAARTARADEFEQRAAADAVAQESYWATFYANKAKIDRAIDRDVALKEQRKQRADTSTGSVTAAASPERVAFPELVEGNDGNICDACGKPMIRKTGKFGKFLACSGYPACKQTKPLAEPAEPSADNLVDMRRAA